MITIIEAKSSGRYNRNDNRACTWLNVVLNMLITYVCNYNDDGTVYIQVVRLRRIMPYVNETRFECKFECLDSSHGTI